jgi:hypothetical protein
MHELNLPGDNGVALAWIGAASAATNDNYTKKNNDTDDNDDDNDDDDDDDDNDDDETDDDDSNDDSHDDENIGWIFIFRGGRLVYGMRYHLGIYKT